MSSDENQFAPGEDVVNIPTESAKNGTLLMIGNFPCKILEKSKAKPGKRGLTKSTYTGKDIFTNKVYEGELGSKDLMRP